MKEKIDKIQIKNKKNNMKLKGTAKIQLFNSETGALEYEKVETNTITNGYLNIINPDWVQSTINLKNYAPIKDLFGGVMLFSDFIDEDVNNILANKHLYSNFIGNAGDGTYTGNSKYRGKRNDVESIEIAMDIDGFGTLKRIKVMD